MGDYDDFEISEFDKSMLAELTVPVPYYEAKRLEILRQTKLLDTTTSDSCFDRYTSLASRLFNMPAAVVALVDIDRVWFKSKLGIDEPQYNRNQSFDAYTILPDSGDVFFVGDTVKDPRFRNSSMCTNNGSKIRFYAGAALVVENVKIGSISIFDTVPHEDFDITRRMNLLDLGSAVSQLIAENRSMALNLSNERANLVVGMMHNLRTPMTSLSFATSLMESEIGAIKLDGIDKKVDDNAMKTIQMSFNEITGALSQLNVLVDSSLSLGQAIINCNRNEMIGKDEATTNGVGGHSVECDLLSNIELIHESISKQYPDVFIEWVIDYKFLNLGTHVSYPDALLLIILTTLGQLSSKWRKIHIQFKFQKTADEKLEYPLLVDKLIEGLFVINVCSLSSDESNAVNEFSSEKIHSSNQASERYKFLSVDKILRSIQGGCREVDREMVMNTDGSFDPLATVNSVANSKAATPKARSVKRFQEYWVPCVILLNGLTIKVAENAIRRAEYIDVVLSVNDAANLLSAPKESTSTIVYLYSGGGKDSLSKNINGSDYESETSKNPSSGFKDTQGGIPKYRLSIINANSPQKSEEFSQLKNAELAKNNLLSSGNGSDSNLVGSSLGPGKEVASEMQTEDTDSVPPVLKEINALVVEDTLSVQKLLSRILQKHGCVVTCANNGKIGLDYLTSKKFDIVLMDFLMPIQSGLTTMKLFNEWKETQSDNPIAIDNKNTLICGMSATALKSEREEGFKYGMHFFCPKPVKVDILSLMLESLRSCDTFAEALDNICQLTNSNTRLPVMDLDASNDGMGGIKENFSSDTVDSANASIISWKQCEWYNPTTNAVSNS